MSQSIMNMIVCKNKDGQLFLPIYQKPTDTQSFLHFNLANPFALKKNSQKYSQALCINIICTEDTETTKI